METAPSFGRCVILKTADIDDLDALDERANVDDNVPQEHQQLGPWYVYTQLLPRCCLAVGPVGALQSRTARHNVAGIRSSS